MKTNNTLKRTLALLLAVLMLASVAAVPVSAVSAPAAPSKVDVVRSTTELKLTWNKVSGATGYRLYYKLPGDLSWRTAVSSTTKTSHTFTSLSYGQTYKFAVRSYVKSGSTVVWGGYKEIATATKTLIPKHFESEQNASAIKLKWTWLNEADGYRLYYKTAPSASWKIAVSAVKGNTNTYTFKNLPASKRYYFAVRGFVHNEFGTFFGDPRYLETATAPATPTAKASTTASSITLSWNKVSADGYRIYYKTGSSDWKVAVSTTAKTTHTFKNLPANKTYTFAVRPYIKTPEKVIWGGYKQFNATTGTGLSGLPRTKAEIAAAYNKAVNDAKHYTGKVTIKKHDIINVELRDLPAIAEKIITPVVANLTKTSPEEYVFVGGRDVNDPARLISHKIVPNGRDAYVKPEGLAKASARANADGGYTIAITFIAETSIFNGVSNITEPKHHKSAMDPLELGTLDLGPITVSNADLRYPGATMTATVDGQGRLIKLEQKLPLEGTGTGKAGISLTLNLAGSMDGTYEFIYG